MANKNVAIYKLKISPFLLKSVVRSNLKSWFKTNFAICPTVFHKARGAKSHFHCQIINDQTSTFVIFVYILLILPVAHC